MKKAIASSPNEKERLNVSVNQTYQYNIRECPSCGYVTLAGMPGGRDATCKNCRFKDPCCYD